MPGQKQRKSRKFVAIARNIAEIEREAAAKRKQASQQEAVKNPKTGQFAGREESAHPVSTGRSRDKVASAVGMSHDTLSKARKVVEQGTPELIDAMDAGEVSVDAAASSLASHPSGLRRWIVADE